MFLSVERLHHFRCGDCDKWWSIGDAPERDFWFCPWCGVKHERRIVMDERARDIKQGLPVDPIEDRLNEKGYTRAPGHIQWDPEGTTPPPDPVTESLRRDLLLRQRVGWTKYGIGLGRPDFTMLDWLQHLEEELMDSLQYTRRLRMTLKGELPVQGPVENVVIKDELPAQEIARLTAEIADRHARLFQLVGGDPRKRVG